MKPLYSLSPGTQPVPNTDGHAVVLARLMVTPSENAYHVAVIVDGREAGSFSGPTQESCEVWFSGWLEGWHATKLRAPSEHERLKEAVVIATMEHDAEDKRYTNFGGTRGDPWKTQEKLRAAVFALAEYEKAHG